jgi:hypothetical protein
MVELTRVTAAVGEADSTSVSVRESESVLRDSWQWWNDRWKGNLIRIDVPVGTQLFYNDAADFVNVIKGFPETGQGARNFTGQKFSGVCPSG